MESFYRGRYNYLYVRCRSLSSNEYDEGIEYGNAKQILKDLKAGYAVYEQLTDRRRIYFDIDGLEDKHPLTFIRKMIRQFSSFLHLKNVTFTVTMNRGSRHPGSGFHVVLNKLMYWKDMRKAVRHFLYTYPVYRSVVDQFVYNRKQLMRMPYSGNAIVGVEYKHDNSWEPKQVGDVERMLYLKKSRYNQYDFHTVIMGSFDETMIGNTNGCEEVRVDYLDEVSHPLDKILKKRFLQPAHNKGNESGEPSSL